MTSFVRLLLLVAAFAYGAMPMIGMSAMAMPMAHAMDISGDAHAPTSTPTLHAMADGDCPHSRSTTLAGHGDGSPYNSTPMKMGGHCAACLTLPVDTFLANSGKPARAAEVSTLSARLVSLAAAPLTPPPRA